MQGYVIFSSITIFFTVSLLLSHHIGSKFSCTYGDNKCIYFKFPCSIQCSPGVSFSEQYLFSICYPVWCVTNLECFVEEFEHVYVCIEPPRCPQAPQPPNSFQWPSRKFRECRFLDFTLQSTFSHSSNLVSSSKGDDGAAADIPEADDSIVVIDRDYSHVSSTFFSKNRMFRTVRNRWKCQKTTRTYPSSPSTDILFFPDL